MKTTNTAKKQSSTGVREETFNVSDLNSRVMNASREKTADRLNDLLANEFSLFTKTLNYHWNVKGPRFHSIHEFLDEQYHDLLKVVDAVAERVREIGGQPMGTLAELEKHSSHSERPKKVPDATTMLQDLTSDHESICMQIQSQLKELDGESDPGTEDFLGSLIKKHEEMCWMLRSHLQ
tara:strand:- start:175634 stop:176170 length:537 start_codon:yes stop_codon:yes gene_type:complete